MPPKPETFLALSHRGGASTGLGAKGFRCLHRRVTRFSGRRILGVAYATWLVWLQVGLLAESGRPDPAVLVSRCINRASQRCGAVQRGVGSFHQGGFMRSISMLLLLLLLLLALASPVATAAEGALAALARMKGTALAPVAAACAAQPGFRMGPDHLRGGGIWGDARNEDSPPSVDLRPSSPGPACCARRLAA